MKNKLIIVTCFMLLLFSIVVNAAPLPDGVTIVVQPESGSSFDTYTLQVNISAEKQGKQPEVFSNNNFEIVGNSQSSNTRIVNGDISINIAYQYLLKPKKTGELKIPDIVIYKDNKKYRIAGKIIKVSDKPNLKNNTKNSKKNNDKIILNLEANKLKAYQGEQIFVRTELLTQVSIDKVEVINNEFSDSWIENIDQKPIYTKFLNGKNYKAAGIENIIFPNAIGKLKISPRKFNLSVVSGFNSRDIYEYFRGPVTKNVIIESNHLEILVRDLPEPKNKLFLPNDVSIPVGKTTLSSKINTNQVKAGESITATFTLKSFGLINPVKDLNLNVPNYVKLYNDKPKIEKEIINNKIQYTKTFSYSLVPSKAENFNIGEVKLSYFNPKNGKYEVASTKIPLITVLEDNNSKNNTIRIPNSNLTEKTKNESSTQENRETFTYLKELSKSISTGLGLLILSIVVVTIFVISIFSKILKRNKTPLPDFININSPEELYNEYKAFIEEKLKLNKSSLKDEIRLLTFKKYPDNTALEIMNILKELEEASFSKNSTDIGQIKNKIKALIKKL